MKNRIIPLTLLIPALFVTSLSAEQRKTPSFTVDVEGQGKAVILIPGLSCSAEVWNGTVQHLNGEGFQTHALTLAGFGGTPPIHADSHYLQTVRDDLASYIEQNKLDHPILIGHSLGGFLVLWTAASYPSLPGKVISVDGLPYLAAVINPTITPEGAKNMAASMAQSIVSGPEDKYKADTKQTLESMITSPQNVDRELKVALTADRATSAEAMKEMMETDIRPEMAKIQVPVLLLGSWIAYKDYNVTHDSTLALYSKEFAGHPGTKIVLNDTSRHFIQLDDPEWFYRQIDAFIK
jgi:pimeloyl-ACP methyl ester carboxylesterase